MCRKNGQLYAKATTYERYNLHFYLNVLIMIILKTNIGDIHIEVDEKKAPITAKNFINYVKNGFYDSTIFHRVIKNFMIQGGGFTEDMSEKSTKKEIENEAKNGLKNAKYTIAMARTTMPHSASSQFFINTTNNSFLDYPAQDGWGYCVFGEVVEGHAVVDKINLVNTGHHGMHADVPNDAIIIKKATVKAVTKKKVVKKKVAAKKTATKKVPVKKVVTKKTPVKKVTTKKTATKKTAPKKTATKKPAKKKSVTKKPIK
ncbi:Peptidyl-prolyl cis-trans isomerase PpiB (EC 5.2.1.8) [uncultured Gammaproteobacteria bacterium]|nr:Peptidyl-prolyl cis-trans isomerase PpiB (EC 5.2.1.8) [uncultured Gammaproteobacteria bacterium]